MPKMTVTTRRKSPQSKRRAAPSKNAANLAVQGEPKDPEDIGHEEETREESDNPDSMMNLIKIIQSVQKTKRNAATASTGTTFSRKQASLFQAAKDSAEDIVNQGVAYIEQAKISVADWKGQEQSLEQQMNDLLPQWDLNDEAVQSLLDVYPTLLEDLQPHRATTINSASSTLMQCPSERARSRTMVMVNFKNRAEENLEREKMATDAAALVAHYKGLLMT